MSEKDNIHLFYNRKKLKESTVKVSLAEPLLTAMYNTGWITKEEYEQELKKL